MALQRWVVGGLLVLLAAPATAQGSAGAPEKGLGSEVIFNWSAARGEGLDLPLLVTLARTERVGGQDLNLTLAGRYSLARAPQTGTWGLRLAVAFTFGIDREGA